MISFVGRTTTIADKMWRKTATANIIPDKRVSAEKVSAKKASAENSQIQNRQVQNSQSLQTAKKTIDSISQSRQAILEIDQYPVFAGLGYKSSIDLVKEVVQKAYQHVIEYIGKTASDGDRLAAIELGGSPIADIAERDAYPEKESDAGSALGGQPKFDVKYITRYYKTDGTIVSTKVDRFV